MNAYEEAIQIGIDGNRVSVRAETRAKYTDSLLQLALPKKEGATTTGKLAIQ